MPPCPRPQAGRPPRSPAPLRCPRSRSAPGSPPRNDRAGFEPVWCPRRTRWRRSVAPHQAGARHRRGCRSARRRGSVVRPRGEDRDHPQPIPHLRRRHPRRHLGDPADRGRSDRDPAGLQGADGNHRASRTDADIHQVTHHPPAVDAAGPQQQPKRPRSGCEAAAALPPGDGDPQRARVPVGRAQDHRPDRTSATPGTLPDHGKGKAPQDRRPSQEGEPRAQAQRRPRAQLRPDAAGVAFFHALNLGDETRLGKLSAISYQPESNTFWLAAGSW